MKRNKFNAVKTVVDNITFDSKKEADRYQQLKLFVKSGAIDNLHLQYKYDFVIGGVNLGYYKADFVYWDTEEQSQIVEDCKGFKTPIYKLKKKLMKAIHRIDIYET